MADKFKHNDGYGSLFKQQNKKNPSHSDYSGSVTVAGREYWLNGWKKSGPKGTYLSLSATPKDGRGASSGGGGDDFDEGEPAPRSASGGNGAAKRDYAKPPGGFPVDDEIPF